MVNKDREWWIKLIAVTIVIVSVVALLVLRQKKPDMDLSVAVYIVVALSIFSIVGFFSKQIKKALEKKEDMLNVMSKEDITKIIINYAHNQRHNNLIITNPIELFKTDTVGSDIIYAIRVKLNLDDEEFIMIINVSFEKREPVYLKADAKTEEIECEMNKIARSPEKSTVNETISENQMTGIKITTRSTLPLKEEKKESEAI